jgi:mRNA-degrading endonuclease RelE of RelBE toxin-antitoxin system
VYTVDEGVEVVSIVRVSHRANVYKGL